MSLLLILDGYNVIAPVAGPGRRPDANWLKREREQLIRRLCEHLPESVRNQTVVVFDASRPPPNRESRYAVNGVEIEFAVEQPEADDLIEERIAQHSSPKQLAVVSSDHRIQEAAKRRGAIAFDSQEWLDDLLDGKLHLAVPIRAESNGAGQGGSQVNDSSSSSGKPKGGVPKAEVDDWLREFGFDQ
ncbi:YacP-like NYN domain protein [Planctomycetes bacterium CA13]|uniref:YacP-like NYN domain protein n=1 Tax=Novipirellula herctigrandis TaxID=2527986 RepID=A0A5C5Z950_9BACT|nr:YacP-like NYN domain protein [Planctomycetes bacterium CA13]